MYELAKSSREKMKAKARRLANPGDYYKDQEVSSADWSPAPPLKTEMKTGARPIMKPSSKGTGESYAARDTKKAIGADMKRGAFKAGGAVKGSKIPSAKETLSTKEIVGANPIKPTRGAAGHYAKGGSIDKKDPKNLYTKDQLRGDKLQKLMDNASHDEDLKRIKDSLDAHGFSIPRGLMPPSSSSGYKKGGKIKKEVGGSLLKRMIGGPKTGSDMSQVGKMGTANYTQEEKGALNRLLNKEDSLPEPAEAAERSGKYQNYKKGGRAERKAGGRTRAKGKTNINIVIAAGRKAGPEMPALDMAAGMPSAPANIPVPMPGAGAPPPAAMPMGGPPGMPSPGILGRKAGGRITKVASSYKDMQAGAGSGEGRLQKTDIAKKHHDAPARKAGGKVYSSYKDMDAGAGSGPGRLEKTEIEKKQRARGK
jgi:hypothetical protein